MMRGFGLIGALCVLLAYAGPAFAACANPAGNAGKIEFNTDNAVMQYCDGTNWIAMSRDGKDPGPYGGTALAPVEVGATLNFATTLNAVEDVAIQGNYAYAVSKFDWLTVLDITDPDLPLAVGAVKGAVASELSDPVGVAVSGNYAYTVNDHFNTTYSDFTVIDISDPANPQIVGTLNTTANDFKDVVLFGTYAFVVDIADRFFIIDISDPSAPFLHRTVIDNVKLDAARGVALSSTGNFAYVAANGATDALTVVDVTDRDNPAVRGTVALTDTAGAEKVVVDGNFAYVAGGNSLTIVDVSDPDAPVERGFLTGGNFNQANDVAVDGTYAYVVTTADRLTIVDVSDPDSPSETSSILSGTQLDAGVGIKVVGNTAYVAAINIDALTVVDVTDRNAPVLKGSSFMVWTGAEHITARDGFAYTASDTHDNFVVVDATNPANPYIRSILKDVTKMDSPLGVTMASAGQYVLVASGVTDSLTVVDATDPDNPIVRGSVTDPFALNGATLVKTQGSFAYVVAISGSSRRITAVDVTDIGAPVVRGTLGNTNFVTPNDLAVFGNYAYVISNNTSMLLIVDISDPDSLVLRGTLSFADQPESLAIQPPGKYLYVGSDVTLDSVWVVDVSDPDNPAIVGTGNAGGHLNFVSGLSVLGHYAYAGALATNRMTVLDIRNPAAPAVRGSVAPSLGGSQDTFVTDTYVYTVNNNGVTVIDIGNNGGCELPHGLEGRAIYNGDSHLMQFCHGMGKGWAGMGRSPAGIDLTNGLVAGWHLDETSGTTATNFVSSSQNGTMQGGLDAANDSVPGQVNSALQFDNTDDHITVPDNSDLDITGPVSLMAWVRPFSFGFSGLENRIVLKGNGREDGSLYLLQLNDAKPSFFLHNAVASVEGPSALTAGRWYHLAGTYDGAVMRVYVDGVETNTKSYTGTGTANANSLIIGGRADAATDIFDGYIDDVRIYNRALTPDEIKYLGGQCANPTARFGKMIYNTDFNVAQYCNGKDWIAIGK